MRHARFFAFLFGLAFACAPAGAQTPVLTLAVPQNDAPGAAYIASLAAPAASEPADVLVLHAKATAMFDAALAADPPLDDRILSLNLDPAAAFAFVRDQIGSQPYAGRLRSPEQVLTARAGNDWDKAALLAEILGRMGYATRMVQGAALPLPAAVCSQGATPDQLALGGLDLAALQRIQSRAEASYAQLAPLLNPAPPAGAVQTGHYWVQMRQGTDWVDLDPWTPGTLWAEHPAGPGVATDPPDPQRVVLSVSVENLIDGQLLQHEILNQSLALPEAADQSLLLSFGPAQAGVGGAVAGALSSIEGQVGTMAAFLTIDVQPQTSTAFALPGAAAQALLADPASLDSGGPTTGLFLTITATAPGLTDLTATRTILDLVPWEKRQAAATGQTLSAGDLSAPEPGTKYPLALESLRQIVVTAGAASARRLAARSVLAVEGLPALLTRVDTGDVTPQDVFDPIERAADRVALMGETLIRAIPAHQGACPVIDRPRVLIAGFAFGPDSQTQWTDWALDDLGTSGGDAAGAAGLRLWHGALSAALEKEMMLADLGVASDAVPLDQGLVPAGPPANASAANDDAQGFQRLEMAGQPLWWRLDPSTGQADARGTAGNEFGAILGGGSVSLGPGGARVAVRGASFGRSFYANAQELQAELDLERAARTARARAEAVRRASEARRPRGGVDYSFLFNEVSGPVSVLVGITVLSVEAGGILGYIVRH